MVRHSNYKEQVPCYEHCNCKIQELSKYLQFITLALERSTRYCHHSSIFFKECTELSIIVYIYYVTTCTRSLFGKTYSTKH